MYSKGESTVLKVLAIIGLFVIFLVSTYIMITFCNIINGIFPEPSKLDAVLARLGNVRAAWFAIRYYCFSAIFSVGSIVGIVLIIQTFFHNKE